VQFAFANPMSQRSLNAVGANPLRANTDMTAIRRGDRDGEWWVDFRWKGQRIRSKAPVQSKRGAEQLERHLRRQFSEDEDHGMDPFAGPPPQFAEFTERWMKEHVVPRNKLASQIEKRSYLKHHLLPAFGRRQLDEIGPREIDAFVAAKVRAGLSPKTINNILATLRRALNIAKDWRLLRSVPPIHGLRVPERQYVWLTATELDRLIEAATPGYWRALVTFIADTGVRFGEAAGLDWDQVELAATPPMVTIAQAAFRGLIGSTKTGRIRHVPITPRVVRELAMLPRRGNLVFERLNGGAPRPESTLDTLHRFCDRAGVQRVGWHALRHYAELRIMPS
jgi:integrase